MTTQTEMSMKQWRYQEALRCGVSPDAIAYRVSSGKYPGLKVRRVNDRVVMVDAQRSAVPVNRNLPRPGEIQMKVWREAESRRLGVGEGAIAMKLNRGGYPELRVRRVNKRVVYVMIQNGGAQ